MKFFDKPNKGQSVDKYQSTASKSPGHGSIGLGPVTVPSVVTKSTRTFAPTLPEVEAPVYQFVLVRDEYLFNACSNSNIGGSPSSVSGTASYFALKPFTSLTDGDILYNNQLLTSPVGSTAGTAWYSNLHSDSFYTYPNDGYAVQANGFGVITSTNACYIPCLVKGTLVLLSNGKHKKIEDIEYFDELSVWNFDDGKFDVAKPLWIKVPQIYNQHNLIKFSDGTELRTLQAKLGHRIFNIEKGMFTYPMTDDTPIGTHTFNERGETVTLISKEIISEEVEYYNIITDRHINLFTNTILTSCRYNNIYPIVDMKFVKDDRILRTREEFINISDRYFNGLRLSEQTFNLFEIEEYMNERDYLDIRSEELV